MAARIFLKADGGSDSNNGETSGAPVQTFHEALEKVSDGGTIEVLDAGPHSPSNRNSLRAVINKNVDIVAADGVTPTIDGTACRNPPDFGDALPGFNTDGSEVVVNFTGFIFQNFNTDASNSGRVGNVIVRQNADITVQYTQCTFKDMRAFLFSNPAPASSASPNKLDRCRIEGSVRSVIFGDYTGAFGSGHILVQNSVFAYGGFSSGNVYLEGVQNNVNAVIRNCSFLVDIDGTTGSSNGLIRFGTIENVIVKNINAGGSYTGLVALNAKTSFSNNCVNGNFATVESTGDGGTIVVAAITTDPLFVSGTSVGDADFNLQLQSSSPCVDTGKTIAAVTVDFDGVARPQGANYDIGAFEPPIWSDEPGNDPFERKFGSNSFEIRSIKNKLRTRRFRVALNNRQAPFSLTLPGPPSIRGTTKSYKTEE